MVNLVSCVHLLPLLEVVNPGIYQRSQNRSPTTENQREMIKKSTLLHCCPDIKQTVCKMNPSEELWRCKTNRAPPLAYSSSNSSRELWPILYRSQACRSSVKTPLTIMTLFVPLNISSNPKLQVQALNFIT